MRTVHPGNQDTRTVLIGGALILLVTGGFFFQRFWHDRSKGQDSKSEPGVLSQTEDGLPTITAETVSQKMTNGEKVRLLDLRSPESFRLEHIPHSLSLSPGAFAAFLPNPDELVIIVYAAKDTQTLEVIKNSLRQKSLKAFLLEGGFEEWKRTGHQVISFGDPNSFTDQSKVIFISPADAITLLKDTTQDIFLLDVQSEANYQKRHIKSAKNIPLDQLEKRSGEIPSSTMILVYGESEQTSFQAGVRLADLNIVTAKKLRGDNNLDPGSPFLFQP